MIKRGVLLLLFLFSFSFVSSYTIKSLDLTYTESDLTPEVLFNTPLSSSVNVVLELDYEDVTSVRFYCGGGSCSNGDLIGSGSIIDNRVSFSFDSSLFYSNFFVFYTDLDSSNYRLRMQNTDTSYQTCVSGCTEFGIVEYDYAQISLDESCSDHITFQKDYSSCLTVNQVNCSDFGAYEPTDLSLCSDYEKYALITPCGDVSTEDFVFTDGETYFVERPNNCVYDDYFTCEDVYLYNVIETGNYDENICGCEIKKTLKDTCISAEFCNATANRCDLPKTSQNVGVAVLNLPKKLIVGETANLISNIEVTWEVLDSNNKVLVLNEVAKEITLEDLEIGTYKVTADGQVNYFDVITCNSDSNCDGQICVNPGSLNSSCKTKICSNDEDCYKIITKEFPLAYDIKCMNPYSIDSYCDYRNITCKIDSDCIDKVPEDATGVKCLNPGKTDSSCEYANCDVACKQDLDCDDGKEGTIDVCQLPSTCQAVCLNKLQFRMIEPEQINYLQTPELNFKLYNSEQCKFKLNGNYETITRLPIQLRNTVDGNNSLVIECESFTYETWFTFGEIEIPKVEEKIAELKEVLSNDKIKQIDKAQEKLKDIITVQNTIEEINGTSQVTTSLDIKENLTDLEVYLQIPKCMAESVKELEFDNEEFKVLIDDPLIMWHFKEAVSQQDLIYRVKKQVSKECFDQLKVMTSADVELDNSWWIYVAIIPVIFIIYSYFSRFAVAPESEEGESDAVKNYVKLLRKRVEKLRAEFSEDKIRTILEEEGIDDALIDKAMSL